MTINHNGTVAKLRAMNGNRLRTEQYNDLAAQRRVSDIAEYLRNTASYERLFDGVNTNTVHRGMIENLLRRSVFESYFRIVGFEHLEKEDFYNFKILQSEVREILVAIQHINAHSDQHIEKLPVYLDKYISFSLIELAKARSREDLLEVLKGTPYRAIIEDIPLRKSGKIDFNPTECALRTHYYKELLGSPFFKRSGTAPLKSLITTDIDLINAINAYRMITYFGETYEYINSLMLPFKGKLPIKVDAELRSSQNKAEFIDRFKNCYYGRVMENYGIMLNESLELETQRLRYNYARQALSTSVHPAQSIYAFTYLYETEVTNIIKIIEGIRYGLPQGDLTKQLVL
jgi:V/A-type H+-transporting ATPase subunit C